MAKNTPKAPAAPADAPKPDATAPAPDTTEASNADQLPVADSPQTAEGAAAQPTADGAHQSPEAAPEVTAAAQPLDPNKVEQPNDTPAAKEPPPPLPKRIKLVTPYGFYDDVEQLRMWHAGHETDDPDEIELLVARGAEFEFLE